MKKLKECIESEKMQLSYTGAITQLPKINEELAREYNTEDKRDSSISKKLEIGKSNSNIYSLESSISKNSKTIESNSSSNPKRNTKFSDEKWRQVKSDSLHSR